MLKKIKKIYARTIIFLMVLLEKLVPFSETSLMLFTISGARMPRYARHYSERGLYLPAEFADNPAEWTSILLEIADSFDKDRNREIVNIFMQDLDCKKFLSDYETVKEARRNFGRYLHEYR